MRESPEVRSLCLAIRDLRLALGWTQATHAARAGVSQSLISAIECRSLRDLPLGTAARVLEAMGARLRVGVARPFIAGRDHQHEPAHAACSAYVASRLRNAGWETRTEVEVGGDRSRGWVDILAFHPVYRIALVIELKTEIRDVGAIERTLGWYEREAWAATRRLGWRPRVVAGVLLLLATDVNEERLRENSASFRLGFPNRARDLSALINEGLFRRRGRGLAMIDPRSRRSAWLRPTFLDGRRASEPYRDYVSFLAARTARIKRSGHESRQRA
jgi:transcriptional regulator with XRE-family HTH domain